MFVFGSVCHDVRSCYLFKVTVYYKRLRLCFFRIQTIIIIVLKEAERVRKWLKMQPIRT